MEQQSRRTENELAHFELTFSPNVALVGSVRRFVGDFYAKVLADAEITSMLVIATHELLENAVKYSSDGNTTIRLGITRGESGVKIAIDTHNRASPTNIAAARNVLAEVIAAGDADALYQSLMRRSAKRTDGSGLGLGRVRAEADMTLSFEIEGDIVALHAVGIYDMRRPNGLGDAADR